MPIRALFLLLLALTTLPATRGLAQTGELPAFGAEGELRRFLKDLADERDRRASMPVQPTGPAPASCVGAPTVSAESVAGTQGPAVVQGRVVSGVGSPLSGAWVSIDPGDMRTVTSADGRYRLPIPAAGLSAGQSVTVTATTLGFGPKQQALTLSPGDSVTVDFRLCASAMELQSLVVAAHGESVTNTQHEGVDEGGIVKVHGDHLVMLRRGRLFTVDVGGGRLAPVAAVDAFGPDLEEPADWYDELLVSGDLVVVVGYSYDRGGTEVSVFRIDHAGRLHHRDTYQLRSDDYYSSRNYASRLVGTRLVMYTPLRVPADPEELDEALPALRRWQSGMGDDDGFRRIAPAARIYRPGRPVDPDDELALHTVTTCELGGREMECQATAVVAAAGRVSYVSPTAVYVWATDEGWGRGVVRSPGMLYRIPLDGSGPGALGVGEGSPVDQFSFLESDDAHLNVVVRSDGRGEGMWGPEHARGGVSLLRVPLARFGDGTRSAPRSAYRTLPVPEGGAYAFQNRFVGRHLLYGQGSGWGEAAEGGSVLHAVPVRGGAVWRVPLRHGVDRIEVMGADAVVVGTDGEDLYFTGVSLDGRLRTVQRYVSRGASQGELRSHGFFYRNDGPDAGVIGLPIRGPGRPGYEHLFDESASVLFLENGGGRFRPLGELEARPDSAGENDGCEASCVDWYGNSRPLFLRGRTFALLGYEIVEGALRAGRIRERRRVSFAPRVVEVTSQ